MARSATSSSDPGSSGERPGVVRGAANRSEYVAERLAGLTAGRAAGERLGTKDALREVCQVSAGTFNEGVKLAQSRGYVTARSGPGGGIFVAALTPVEKLGNAVRGLDASASLVAEAVRMRDALDPLLIHDVLWHASATDVGDLRIRLRAMREALDGDSSAAFIAANWSMHARIAEVTPNVLLRSVYLSLLEIVMVATLAAVRGDDPVPDHYHRRHNLAAALIDAVEARDTEAATRLVEVHNELVRSTPGDLHRA